jgi:hypothetical protein
MDFLCRFRQACIIHLPKETKVKSEKFSICGQKGFIVGYKGTTIYRVWIPTSYSFSKVIESLSIKFDLTDLYENKAQKLQEDNGVLDFKDRYSLKLSNSRTSLSTSSELGGERTSNTDADDEEPFIDNAESFTDVVDNGKLNSTCKPSEKSYTHSN